MLVEVQVHPGWKLIEPPKPVERTPSVYRFEVAVEPGKRQELDGKEEKLVSETVGLLSADVNLRLLYSKSEVG